LRPPRRSLDRPRRRRPWNPPYRADSNQYSLPIHHPGVAGRRVFARHLIGQVTAHAQRRERKLLRRAADGRVVVLDVRPGPEYAAAHMPGAVHIHLTSSWTASTSDRPTARSSPTAGRQLRPRPRRRPITDRPRSERPPSHRRHPRVAGSRSAGRNWKRLSRSRPTFARRRSLPAGGQHASDLGDIVSGRYRRILRSRPPATSSAAE
jgi:hypothetical protein